MHPTLYLNMCAKFVHILLVLYLNKFFGTKNDNSEEHEMVGIVRLYQVHVLVFEGDVKTC